MLGSRVFKMFQNINQGNKYIKREIKVEGILSLFDLIFDWRNCRYTGKSVIKDSKPSEYVEEILYDDDKQLKIVNGKNEPKSTFDVVSVKNHVIHFQHFIIHHIWFA